MEKFPVQLHIPMWLQRTLYFVVSHFYKKITSLASFLSELLSYNKKRVFQFPCSCYIRRDSCLIFSFADILQSRSRASIWKFLAFTFSVASSKITCFCWVGTLCAGVFELLPLLLVIVVTDTLVLQPLVVSKSSFLNVSLRLSALGLIWLYLLSRFLSLYILFVLCNSFYSGYFKFRKFVGLSRVVWYYSRFNRFLLGFYFFSCSTSFVKKIQSIALQFLLFFVVTFSVIKLKSIIFSRIICDPLQKKISYRVFLEGLNIITRHHLYIAIQMRHDDSWFPFFWLHVRAFPYQFMARL